MNAVLAIVVLLGELALGVALVGGAAITLSFSNEAYRNNATPTHQALNLIGFAFAVLPTLVTLWVGWRRLLSDRPFDTVPLGMGLPVVGLVLGGALFMACVTAGSWVTDRARTAQRAAELAALRAEVEGGAKQRACELVVEDATASAADMRRCRDRIESLSDVEARWMEFSKFLDASGYFETHEISTVGLSPVYDFNRSVPVVRYDQEWFLPTFYETWLARPQAFASAKSLEQLQQMLQSTTRYAGWDARAINTFRARVLPVLTQRLDADDARLRALPGLEEWTLRSLREQLQRSPEEGIDPLPPLPGTPPPDAIGVARLDDTQHLQLWLRSTPTSGEFGDVFLSRGSYMSEYEVWMKHLGPMRPGEVRFVPPIPAR